MILDQSARSIVIFKIPHYYVYSYFDLKKKRPINSGRRKYLLTSYSLSYFKFKEVTNGGGGPAFISIVVYSMVQ